MINEQENWREKFSESEDEGRREGYQPQGTNNNERNGAGERRMRPRISRPIYSNSGHEGYQPREGASQPRPRYNRDDRPRQGSPRGGYGSGYNSNAERVGSYRPRYNREGGYQPREGGYQQREGYQPREGGYQQREGYQPRPRYNQGEGYKPREGGYQQRPRYNREGGGYQPRQGGYNRRPRTADYNPHAKYSMKKQIEYKETHIDPDEPIRLNKYLANAGICSRREADEFITAGVVSVNGQVVTELGTKVKRSDTVLFHDQLVNIENKVYVLLNKPNDYVTTSDDPQNRKTVMDLVQGACRERIYPVGRLDRNTTGVLLLTNDGELAAKLTHPQFLKKKIYHVFLDKNVSPEDMRQIAEGIELEDGEIHADAIEYANEKDRKQVGIEIHSGRNRIVRRIFEHLGYKVIRLDRVFFAGLTKKNVRRGDWRFLTEKEVNMLRMGAFE